MGKCSCGKYFYHRATDFTPYQNLDNEPHGWYDENANEGNNFCPSCGDQLLPDGRVIQRESVPNKLMAMLREVQANCPEAGLQEFALKCFNWIWDMREEAGVDGRRVHRKGIRWADTHA